MTRRDGPRRVLARDAEFDEFFAALYPRAVAVALRVTGERHAAEDAAIEALAKAHVRWRRVGTIAHRDLWVLRVAVNEAIRRLPRRPVLSLRPDVVADPAEQVVLRATLSAALRQLPRRQREAVVLRYLVGLSETEVATSLDVSLGTVKTHLRRGLARLRGQLARSLKEETLANPA